MIKGIFISSDGEVEVIGEFHTYQPIIRAMKQSIPELEQREYNRIASEFDLDVLQQLVELRRRYEAHINRQSNTDASTELNGESV